MRIFKAVFIANAREYIRDKTAMFWFLLFPLIFVFLFGWIFTGISESSYNIGIILHSDDQFSTSLLEELRSISSFNITVERGSGTEELEALRKGKRALVLELPDFSSVSTAAGAIEIPVYYDSSKQQSSRVLLSVFSEMFNEIEREIIGIPKIFLLKAETIHTEELTDFDYILPGILAMALMQLGLFGSLSFLSMRERKIIRGLGVTPVSRTSILLSEILLRLILALVQTTII
ncbi:MAG: ABC transporter permease, partial [Halanaerobiaceae bacterium]|nr:ABC transporter permease [Halanaerobiaceae bacterium]